MRFEHDPAPSGFPAIPDENFADLIFEAGMFFMMVDTNMIRSGRFVFVRLRNFRPRFSFHFPHRVS